MEALLGIPEWLAATLFVTTALAGWLGLAFLMRRRGMRRLAASRPSPSREEFVDLLAGQVDGDTATWLWEQASPYYVNATSPHPDDDLGKDAMIDDGDWSMDWPSQFAKARRFDEDDYPDWPVEWPATLRNFGRWLDMGRKVSAQS